MPDPQRDIAPLIEPAAPPPAPAEPDHNFGIALVLGGLLLAFAAYWYWRRRAPLRALRRIARASDPVAGADALAALMANRGISPPAFWQEELELLRFGPPGEDAEAMLSQLCQGAESLLRGR